MTDEEIGEPDRQTGSSDTPGLEEPRRRALARLGVEVPEIVEALAVAIERGHHLAALAGEGSGKEYLYGFAAARRVDPSSPELQALILSPTPETAARAARALHVLGGPDGLEVLLWPPEGADTSGGDVELPLAHVLVGRPERLLAEIRSGRLPLSHVGLLVLDGIRTLKETGAWEAVEALVDSVEGEVQRIAVSDRLDARLESLLERRLPRARRWPRELFPEAIELDDEDAGRRAPRTTDDAHTLWCVPALGEEEELRALSEGLRTLAERAGKDHAFVHCPDEKRAHRTAAALAVRGFRLTEDPPDPGVAVVWGDEEPPEGGVAALMGVPAGLDALRRRLGPARHRLLVAPPAHVPQVELLARRASWPLRMLATPDPGDLRGDVERFREAVRAESAQVDAATSFLLLEPLLEELGGARLAAVLASLLRRGGAELADRKPFPATAVRERGARPTRRRARTEAPAVERSVRPAWTRIFVNVGKRDGAGPGDLVGAITGETPAVGGQIGKIEVRDTYSLVDLDSQIVDEVLSGLEGAVVKGREIRARRDRKA